MIPGDFFDGPKIDFARITSIFRGIQARHGVIFSNGNHEEYRNTGAIIDSFETAGIQVLNGKKVEIEGITFAGVSYHSTETVEGLEREIQSLQLDPKKPTIFLKHKPTLHNILANHPIDLVVSGHTHRGQMWPGSLITRGIYGKFVYGMHTLKNLTAITTSGVGTWGPPQRIGTRSEVVVIEIL